LGAAYYIYLISLCTFFLISILSPSGESGKIMVLRIYWGVLGRMGHTEKLRIVPSITADDFILD